MDQSELIDLAEKKQCLTDSEVSRLCGVERQRIYDYRKGKKMTDTVCIIIAKLAGLNPLWAMAEIRSHWPIKEREHWRKIAEILEKEERTIKESESN